MYSELIYTRCGEGIDILRNGNTIKSSGFKVFACSSELTTKKDEDLQFLNVTAQCKFPYTEPAFMDDAYMYTVPDIGNKYFLDFHPIPVDRNAEGNYSHRSGNFINQVFIGSFVNTYPYVLFGNSSVWDAKEKGEAYYYENSPAQLPLREDFVVDTGSVSFDDISAFISVGRRETLKKAIAFIISQYSLAPEERKFLVIKDENSSNIELWIAAIESAFSPRMASGLSFATRLDKFVNTNRYTVNIEGRYQPQMNLQNPNQKMRLRAMIVGVDERDRTNASAVRALPNSPFVVLDGKNKTMSSDFDTTNAYFQIATAFNDVQRSFCSEYMQMFELAAPTEAVFKLYSAYSSIAGFYKNNRLEELITAISILKQFRLVRTVFLENLYGYVKKHIPEFLVQDPGAAFTIMEWLRIQAPVVGDTTFSTDFVNLICQTYANCIYLTPQNESTAVFHNTIKKSGYVNLAMDHFVSHDVFSAYQNVIQAYTPNDWISFLNIYLDVLGRIRVFVDSVNVILPASVRALIVVNDQNNALKIVSQFYSIYPDRTANILLLEAGRATDKNYAGLLVLLMCKSIPPIFASDKNLECFLDDLYSNNLADTIPSVLLLKARSLNKANEMESFYYWLTHNERFKYIDLSKFFSILDQKLSISDKSYNNIAYYIQKDKPQTITCIKSAHLVALYTLGNQSLNIELVAMLDRLIAQGVPSIEDGMYADKFITTVLSRSMPVEALKLVLSATVKSQFYLEKLAKEVALRTENTLIFRSFFIAAAQVNSEGLFKSLVSEYAKNRHSPKILEQISKTIGTGEGAGYLGMIEKEVRQIFDNSKKESLFGKLGKKISRDSSSDK